jgi:multidrug efflux pump subunit AcrA (membrane-fusion protein)
VKPFCFAAVLCAGILGGGPFALSHAAADDDPEALPSAQVIVVRAKNACFSEAIHVTGFLVARKEAVVTLDAPGFQISEVLVSEGDKVNSGQILARATREAGENPGAGPSTRVSMNLKAPLAGSIMRSAAIIGASASSLGQEPLFMIAADNEIELEAEVPSIHLPALAPGQRARIVIGDRELSGFVRRVPSLVASNTQLGRARIALELISGIRVGMFAQATIDANRSCGVSVPTSAVTYQTGGTSVQVVQGNTIETRQVRVGFHSDTETEVRAGLREGDMVVANAGSSLRNGDKVTPTVANTSQLP